MYGTQIDSDGLKWPNTPRWYVWATVEWCLNLLILFSSCRVGYTRKKSCLWGEWREYREWIWGGESKSLKITPHTGTHILPRIMHNLVQSAFAISSLPCSNRTTFRLLDNPWKRLGSVGNVGSLLTYRTRLTYYSSMVVASRGHCKIGRTAISSTGWEKKRKKYVQIPG